MLHHAGEKLQLENEPFRLPETLPREPWLPVTLLYQITQTDVDMQSPLRADCWILIQHRKAIIKAAPHQRWAPPRLPHISTNKHSNPHISPTGGRDISYLSLLTEGENKIRRKGFSLCGKSAPILQFCLFPGNASRSALQATNNRIGNLQSFNLTGALNI